VLHVFAEAWAWVQENEGWRLSLSLPSLGGSECGLSRVSLPAMPSIVDFPELNLLH